VRASEIRSDDPSGWLTGGIVEAAKAEAAMVTEVQATPIVVALEGYSPLT
jgi:hypothetical protein